MDRHWLAVGSLCTVIVAASISQHIRIEIPVGTWSRGSFFSFIINVLLLVHLVLSSAPHSFPLLPPHPFQSVSVWLSVDLAHLGLLTRHLGCPAGHRCSAPFGWLRSHCGNWRGCRAAAHCSAAGAMWKQRVRSPGRGRVGGRYGRKEGRRGIGSDTGSRFPCWAHLSPCVCGGKKYKKYQQKTNMLLLDKEWESVGLLCSGTERQRGRGRVWTNRQMQKKEKKKRDGRRKSQSEFRQQGENLPCMMRVHAHSGVAALWDLLSIFTLVLPP